jgi:hypothetical protein
LQKAVCAIAGPLVNACSHKQLNESLKPHQTALMHVSKTLGGWSHEPFDEKISEEMID